MMYHGAHTNFALHPGICLTDDVRTAQAYARRGFVAGVVVDLAGLTVQAVEGYNRDADVAPGDDGDSRGADVLVYTDEDPDGREHQTWRLMTPSAIARVSAAWAVSADWAAELADAGLAPHRWTATVEAWTDAGADADDYTTYDGDLDLFSAENA
jgi:hypothetical protein